jgi:hypothetical protein
MVGWAASPFGNWRDSKCHRAPDATHTVLPQAKQVLDLFEECASNPFRLAAPFDQDLKVPLEVRPARLALWCGHGDDQKERFHRFGQCRTHLIFLRRNAA